MAQDLQKLSTDIGKLSGLVEAMTARLDHNDQALGDFMTSTSQSRLKLHERIEEQREDFDRALNAMQSDLRLIQQSTVTTATNLAALSATVATEVKPQIDKIRRWELMGIGFLSMAGIAGAGIGLVIANWGQSIADFFLKRGGP